MSYKDEWKGGGENQMETLRLKALEDEEKDASPVRCF